MQDSIKERQIFGYIADHLEGRITHCTSYVNRLCPVTALFNTKLKNKELKKSQNRLEGLFMPRKLHFTTKMSNSRGHLV